MGDNNGKPPARYLYLREKLRFEHSLLGGRMTYYMTSQSFLFTAAAIAWATQWHGVHWLFGVLLPLVGMAASAVLLYSIHAGYGRMDQWREMEKQFEGKHPVVVLYPRGQAAQVPDVDHTHSVSAHGRVGRVRGPDPRFPAARRGDVTRLPLLYDRGGYAGALFAERTAVP